MTRAGERSMEIIAVTSGKGGTGKTLISSCLGYALTRAGHRVLLIDADLATDGLSLFVLGPQGVRQMGSFQPDNTFAGLFEASGQGPLLEVKPREIHRAGADDHGVTYEALISGRGLYGDAPPPALVDREKFRTGVASLFKHLKEHTPYDYVIVDTRGGFSFETTDVCALASSFIVVTEPDYTSFYQARNLVREVSSVALELGNQPVLRAIFVNKATEITAPDTGNLNLDKMEEPFRHELVREFERAGIRFENTYPVPLDPEVLRSYKTQRNPLQHAPAFRFSFAVMAAFSDILSVVTSPWTREQVQKWNDLVDSISATIAEQNNLVLQKLAEQDRQAAELAELREQVKQLRLEHEYAERELVDARARYEREVSRSDTIVTSLRSVGSAAPAAPSVANRGLNSVTLVLVAVGLVLATIVGSVAVTNTLGRPPSPTLLPQTPAATNDAQPVQQRLLTATTQAPPTALSGPTPAASRAPTSAAGSVWRPAMLFSGHTDTVYTSAFSPNARLVVTASQDTTARVWDTQTGKALGVLPATDVVTWSAEFSPDSTRIVTASDDGIARIFLASAAARSPGLALFAPLFHDVLLGSDSTPTGIPEFPTSTPTSTPTPTGTTTSKPTPTPTATRAASGLELRGHTGPIHSATFSGDGSQVLTAGNDGTIRVWNSTTGRQLAAFDPKTGRISRAVFCVGNTIASAGDDAVVRLWDSQTGKQLAELKGHTGPVYGLGLSPDGKWLVSAGHEGHVLVHDANSYALVADLRGHDGNVYAAEFSPDGKWLATAGADHTTRIWDTTTFRQSASLTSDGEVRDVSFSPDSKSLLTAAKDKAQIWTLSQ